MSLTTRCRIYRRVGVLAVGVVAALVVTFQGPRHAPVRTRRYDSPWPRQVLEPSGEVNGHPSHRLAIIGVNV
jgi:hypothetical protein